MGKVRIPLVRSALRTKKDLKNFVFSKNPHKILELLSSEFFEDTNSFVKEYYRRIAKYGVRINGGEKLHMAYWMKLLLVLKIFNRSWKDLLNYYFKVNKIPRSLYHIVHSSFWDRCFAEYYTADYTAQYLLEREIKKRQDEYATKVLAKKLGITEETVLSLPGVVGLFVSEEYARKVKNGS